MNDLWPNELMIEEDNIKPPVTILKEQASFLAKKTKNVLEGYVRTYEAQGNKLVYSFNIIAPVLDNYSYELFFMHHTIGYFYPLEIGTPDLEIYKDMEYKPQNIVVNDENGLMETIRRILQTRRVKEIISNLYLQSKA